VAERDIHLPGRTTQPPGRDGSEPSIEGPSVLWLDDPAARDVTLVGGKGAGLATLTAAGFSVPRGFVLGIAAHRRAVAAADATGTPVPTDGDVRAVIDAYLQLGDGVPVAVRSSSIGEDSEGASFAGVHESYLDVVGHDAVLARVHDCWSSLHGARARAYGSGSRPPGERAMAVVVQELVPAERAGVMFTAHPLTGDPATTVIEAARGRGEAVVAGGVQPDTYEVATHGSDVRSVRGGDIGGAAVLSEAEVVELARLGAQVQALMGSPQDVEWAMTGGDVHLLQARPITTPLRPAADAPSPRATGAARVLVSGLAASSGRATGPVRVLHDPDERDDLVDGEVLVAPTTDPDWLPTILRAAAVVTDTGGIACHAAIVARELGVPCVVGTGTSTAALADGQVVTVDGTAGEVRAAS
jgi:pyruvate,water dikinase